MDLDLVCKFSLGPTAPLKKKVKIKFKVCKKKGQGLLSTSQALGTAHMTKVLHDSITTSRHQNITTTTNDNK